MNYDALALPFDGQAQPFPRTRRRPNAPTTIVTAFTRSRPSIPWLTSFDRDLAHVSTAACRANEDNMFAD